MAEPAPMKVDLLQFEDLAERLRALGHPIRLAMAMLLHESGAQNVTAIHTALDIDQATASHHLRIMRTAGILSVERDGKSSIYRLEDKRLGASISLLR